MNKFKLVYLTRQLTARERWASEMVLFRSSRLAKKKIFTTSLCFATINTRCELKSYNEDKVKALEALEFFGEGY